MYAGFFPIFQTAVSLSLLRPHTPLLSLFWDVQHGWEGSLGFPDRATSDHIPALPQKRPHTQHQLPAPGAASGLQSSGPRRCHISMTNSLKSELPGQRDLDRRVTRASWSSQNLILVISETPCPRSPGYWQLRLSGGCASSRFACGWLSTEGSELHICFRLACLSAALLSRDDSTR